MVQDYGREKSSGVEVDGYVVLLIPKAHTPNAPTHPTNPTWGGGGGLVGARGVGGVGGVGWGNGGWGIRRISCTYAYTHMLLPGLRGKKKHGIPQIQTRLNHFP